MNDCYANFIIQFILIKSRDYKFEEIIPIIEKIENNILNYSKAKYSASVIEKCFERGDLKIKEHICQYLVNYCSDKLIDIILNQYGLYIIKKALTIESKSLTEKIMNVIISNINIINNDVNGKKFLENLNQNDKVILMSLINKK